MANRKNRGGVVEDIWMNTQVDAEDLGVITPTGPNDPASWDEVEEANVLINPDVSSMEGRG